MSIYDKYETIVGLEVHAQLLTRSKAYSSESYTYGSKPNTQLSPISIGHPGTLPRPNLAGLQMAIKMGLACDCDIQPYTYFARKNYFYADLPKAYQITQYTTPLCTGGHIMVKDAEGRPKKITLDKIIMEEDSGKSIHDLDPFASLIDLNRAGVPLIEIVSNPDIREPEEAYQYLTEIRQLVQYLDICDGNMEEGSLRCDANVSIRLRGEDVLNTRVEIKNMNSIRNVSRAIAAEVKRQIELVEGGGEVTPDTRGFDPVKGETFAMRSKELANDYRYFPEPDIPPLVLKNEEVDKVRAAMPELPKALRQRMVNEFGLSEYDAGVITAEKDSAEYYLELTKLTGSYKAAANWLNGPVRSHLNTLAIPVSELKLKAATLAQLVKLVEDNKISFGVATQKVFPVLLENSDIEDVEALVQQMNLIQVDDDGFIINFIREVMEAYPDKVEEYRSGKKGIMGLFMGEVMKKSQGKADPKKTSRLLAEELQK